MNLNFLRLGGRTLVRDLRAGGLRLLIVAVALAVAALTAVGFFADRHQRGLRNGALQLLGGDAVVASDHPTPAAFVERARALGLQSVSMLGFATMARASDAQGGASRLVALKSVQPGYPLRGSLTVADFPGAPGQSTRNIPAPGQVWVDAPLLDALNLAVGDPLLLGDAQLRIARIIVTEPDRSTGFIGFAPRVMLHAHDLPATGLVQPASRLSYRFAVAGPAPAVQTFSEWAAAEAKKPGVHGLRLESVESGRPEMRQALERAEKFMNLVALLAALLSAVAVALAARSFAAAHLDSAALLRVLGQSQRSIAGAYTTEFALVGLIASALGAALGYLAHHAFVLLLAGLIGSDLPPPGLWPLALGLGMGLTLLLAFGLPPVLQLARVPPLRVIRRDLGGLKPASLAVLAAGVAGFAGLLLVVSRDLVLGLTAVGGFAGAAALFAGLSWVALRLLRRGVNERTAPRWLVLATRQIAARPAYAVLQVSGLALGLLALVLLVLLRTDLISGWRQASPPDAPNRFVINVMPEQSQAFRQALADGGVARYDWYPMVRGRLIAVNGKPVDPGSYADEHAGQLVAREFNLSNALERPAHNPIVAGRWTPGEEGAVSVEEGLAKTLGLHLGDRLRFDVGGVQNEARITSLRKVDWGSMRANFFVMYPVAALRDVPLTYLAAYRAPATPGFDNALVRQFPNVTNVDMSATIDQLQRVLEQVVRAVEFLFAFTLAAGLVVLFAAVSATREERAREYAIMRAVGARASLLRQVQRAELAGVGLLAGFLASAAALAVGWALARFAFGFSWNIRPWVPLAGAAAGAVLALAAGWWGLRAVLLRPVVDTLRRCTE
ncbi:FtsX-like permease family protein [Verminephrobacter aporrectodeae subsp. tuberculatae]|uniref:ABC transporter permease n=1 Tax=Verminephrobacter aporrectodeae TaxID=1110389 RepID=UPI002243AF3B|nr:FtsX-like permease family protein [Verminephrobacter aporrectodeae]MCW8197893.1 FtsX-like permease family protein [Verminephrobacter aporrectodeae subsp. tuberculatae]